MRASKLRYLTLAVTAALFVAGFGCAARAQSAPEDVLSRDSVLRDPAAPAVGNAGAEFAIVEYFDYQCPYCKKVEPVLRDVVGKDGNIRLVLKDWPIFGDVSRYAAGMALAAKFQGKYAEAHDALITAKSRLSEPVVRELLAQAGIDVAKASADLDAHRQEIDELLRRNDAQARAFGFPGTPGFIIGTFRVPGVLSAEGFNLAIKDARAAAAAK
jgi:protein-disulfide isomerase